VRGGDHASGSGTLQAGYRMEFILGNLATAPEPGTQLIYNCLMGGWDHVPSTDPGCEGQQTLGRLGYLWTTPPPGQTTRPVYRCVIPSSGDHFISHNSDCESSTREGLLGYVVNNLPQ
jgi:hypothetical protein